MTQYSQGSPLAAVRLRNWPPGRAAAFKLMVSHLQDIVNSSLASQVEQSSDREFSSFIPKIPDQNIEGSVDFRSVRFTWTPPLVDDLLFFELEISRNQFFNNIDQTVTTPDPAYTFSNLIDAQIYYVRLRIVTTQPFVGPWSDTIQVTTPIARVITHTNNSTTSVNVTTGTFATLFTFSATDFIDGVAWWSLDYEFSAINAGGNVFYWADAEFLWLVDGNQQGPSFFLTSFDSTSVSSPQHMHSASLGTVIIPSFAFVKTGSFFQVPFSITKGSHTIELQARLLNNHPTVGELTFSPIQPTYGSSCTLTFRNFATFNINLGAI